MTPAEPRVTERTGMAGGSVFNADDVVNAFLDAQRADFSETQARDMLREANRNGASRDHGDGYRIFRVGDGQYTASISGKPLLSAADRRAQEEREEAEYRQRRAAQDEVKAQAAFPVGSSVEVKESDAPWRAATVTGHQGAYVATQLANGRGYAHIPYDSDRIRVNTTPSALTVPRGSAAHPRRQPSPHNAIAGEIRQVNQRIHAMGGSAAQWTAQEVVQGSADDVRRQIAGGAKVVTAQVPGGTEISMTPEAARRLLEMETPPRPPWWPGGA